MVVAYPSKNLDVGLGRLWREKLSMPQDSLRNAQMTVEGKAGLGSGYVQQGRIVMLWNSEKSPLKYS